jgi:hypothetical protein
VLADSFGRIVTDLRVSVTDRRNLRCSYCMPAEGLDWLPSPALLTDGEMARLIAIAGTASTTTASCSPPGRCQPSAADRAARSERPAEATGQLRHLHSSCG